MLGIFATLVLNILDYIIIIKFYDTFLGRKENRMKWTFLLHSAVMIMLGIIINSFGVILLNIIVTVTILLLTGIIFYKGSHALKLGMCSAYIGIGVISENIILSVVGMEYIGNEIYTMLLIAICQLIKYLILLMIGKFKKENDSQKISKETSALMTLIFSGVAGMCIILNWNPVRGKTDVEIITMLSLTIIALVMYILMFLLFDRSAHTARVNYEQNLLIQEGVLKETYYKEIDANDQEMRKIKHDFKNQLIVLCDLMENDAETARESLHDILDEVIHVDDTVYTNNRALNAICNVKFSHAMKLGIDVKCEISLPDEIGIDYGEMGILYGNLLDNAIEACERINGDDKSIFLDTYIINGNRLVIILKNTKPDGINKRLLTTKPDKVNHGFGIKSVKKIVNKYSGMYHVMEENSMFTTTIELYNIMTDMGQMSMTY